MADQLSGIAVIICIAFGVLTFILLFIFAKRQIVRFSLKSRRGPHVPVGIDAPKKLSLEIERRLNVAAGIWCEPSVLKLENNELFSDGDCENLTPTHLYRMKVAEEMRNLDHFIASTFHTKKRIPGEDVTDYYTKLHREGVLSSMNITSLNKFLELYDHARYFHEDFTYAGYKSFMDLLSEVRSSISASTALSDDDYTTDSGFQVPHVPKECGENAFLLKKSISFDARPKKQACCIETEV